MRVRRAIVVVIAASVVWTAVSFLTLAMTVHPCHILLPVPPGGFPPGAIPTITQAEMDAQTAACNQPRPGDLVVAAFGYILIVGVGVAYATGGKREGSVDP